MEKKKRARNPNGNPDFGKSIKAQRSYDELLSEKISIRLTPSQLKAIKKRPRGWARDALLSALGDPDPTSPLVEV